MTVWRWFDGAWRHGVVQPAAARACPRYSSRTAKPRRSRTSRDPRGAVCELRCSSTRTKRHAQGRVRAERSVCVSAAARRTSRGERAPVARSAHWRTGARRSRRSTRPGPGARTARPTRSGARRPASRRPRSTSIHCGWRVRLVRVVRVEVRVALPEGRQAAVVEARIAVVVRLVDRVAAARQAIAVGHGEAAARDATSRSSSPDGGPGRSTCRTGSSATPRRRARCAAGR